MKILKKMDIGQKLKCLRIIWVNIYPFFVWCGDIVLQFVNISLIDLSIFLDLFNQGTVHPDFGPLPPPLLWFEGISITLELGLELHKMEFFVLGQFQMVKGKR